MWWFYSFSPERFRRVFGGNEPGMAELVADAATYEEGSWDDPAVPRRLAAVIVQSGIDYAGLSRSEASVLDEMMQRIFAPEGPGKELEVIPESPDGLHPNIVQELLAIARGRVAIRLLPILVGGRRYGQLDPNPECRYCILSTDEITQLLAEVQQILALADRCTKDYVPKVARECLGDVLQSAATKNRPLIGLFS